MVIERRNDVGFKMVWLTFNVVFLLILTIFFNSIYNGMTENAKRSLENEKQIAIMQNDSKAIQLCLVELKTDIKDIKKAVNQ